MSSHSLPHSLQRKLQICIWIKNVVPEKQLHSTQGTGLPSPHTHSERKKDPFILGEFRKEQHFVDYTLSKVKQSPWGKEEGERNGIPP